jgi:hypothetical protein
VPALPLNEDPYQDSFGTPEPVSAVIAPSSKTYDVVFDTRSRATAGAFTFRLWINDTAPPALKLFTPVASGSATVAVAAKDAGSGVDPSSIVARVDGTRRPARLAGNVIVVSVSGASAGRHTLDLTVSDYQETKNMETYGGVLPNTRVYRASFTVR